MLFYRQFESDKKTTGMQLLIFTLLPMVTMATIIDLTHTYGPDVLYPPVGPNGTADMFNFTIIHRGIEKSLNHWLEINWFGVFEHGGTHIDAPAHYHRGGRHVHEIPPDQLIGPGVMIDIRASLPGNRDYLMTIQDILAWEEKHGSIPINSIVMMNTGRHKVYSDRKLFYDSDTPLDTPTIHNPGIDPMAARWLVQNRQIKAFGTDCQSPDPGQNFNQNLAHEEFLSNNVLILEAVAQLDRMPPTGSTIFFAPIKMRDGSGGPTRILAMFGEDDNKASNGGAVIKNSILLLITVVFLSSDI